MDVIYHLDTPGGAFPSSHVAAAVVCVLMAARRYPLLGWAFVPFCTSLIASTVYCRYHYAVDAVAGIFAAVVAVIAADWLFGKLSSPSENNSGITVGSENEDSKNRGQAVES